MRWKERTIRAGRANGASGLRIAGLSLVLALLLGEQQKQFARHALRPLPACPAGEVVRPLAGSAANPPRPLPACPAGEVVRPLWLATELLHLPDKPAGVRAYSGVAHFLPLAFTTARLPATDSAPTFTLHTMDGIAAIGPWEELREDWSVSLGGEKAARFKGAEVVALRRVGARLPPPPRESQVFFSNGDRLSGKILGLVGQRLRLQAQIGTAQEMAVPLTAVSVLWLTAPDATEDLVLVQRRLAAETRTRDRVLLRNGDAVEGTLTGLDDKRLRIETSSRQEMPVDLGKVAAVALNTELVRSLRPKGVYGHLVLANGCRLSLASAQANRQFLTGKTLFGTAVEVPLEQIVALDLRQGRAVYLSDLKPRRYEHLPYLGVRWPYVPDGSVAGRELHLGGSTYDKGIGMHSESRLTYDLARTYRWFEALVGLDDDTGRAGNVEVEVLVDGKVQDLGWGPELRAPMGPRAVRVGVAGARELMLVVKFGRHGDVHDHVDWVDARLLK